MCAISFQDTKYALTVGVLQHLFHQKYGYFTCSLLERHQHLVYSFLGLNSLTKNIVLEGINKIS